LITSFKPFTDGFYETGHQVHDWVLREARGHFQTDRARRAKVTDAASFAAYREHVRVQFLKSIGGLPQEKVEAAPIETGRIAGDGYAIRKLIYQALPGYYVTSLLYVPDGLKAPAAGVLMACGHNGAGKAAPAYQKVCIDLVRTGFVVLIIDSPGHGEMVQCLDAETGQPIVGINTVEHSFLQISSSILGQNVARYFLIAAMRGIDLLESLPEVDASRIGATGNSGGGTLTQYLMVTDPRVRAAMPCCSVSTRESYLHTGSRAYDGEQNLFGCLPGGVDYTDFLAAFAPRPVRVGAAEFDFFAIEGVEQAVDDAHRVYSALNAEAAIDLCIAVGESHGYSTRLRRGCVDWFARHLQGRPVEPLTDDPAVRTPAELQCTRSGQVMREFADARSILDLNRETWQRQQPMTPSITRDELAALLKLPPATPLRARRTSRSEGDGWTAERLFFFSQPGIVTTAVIYLPRTPVTRATLLLVPDGTEGQEPFANDIGQRVAAGQVVMVFDVRGTGAVKMNKRNDGAGLAFRSTEFRVASDHFQLGTSLAARRAYDVRQALAYLRGRPEVTATTPVELVGRGWPAIYGLLAAALDGKLTACDVELGVDSWETAFEPRPLESTAISESLILPELAGRADLVDLHRLANDSESK
jgi:dienelactone hydrolase